MIDLPANLQPPGRWYNVGGRLRVSAAELVFEPRGRINNWVLPTRISLPLSDVRAVSVTGRRGSPFAGAGQRRLRVERSDGSHLVFVVRGVDDVRAQVERLVSQASA